MEGSNIKSLVTLSVASLARLVQNDDSKIMSLLPSLPTELLEKLLHRLGVEGLLTNRSLMPIAPLLTTLDFSRFSPLCKLDDSTLAAIATCPSLASHLRVLDVSTCFLHITPAGVKQILENCLALESMSLAGCHVDDSLFDFTPLPLPNGKRKSVDVPCPYKKHKHMTGEFSPGRPQHPFTRSNLLNLNISGCSRITNRGLSLIPQLFPGLMVLDCSHIEYEEPMDISPILRGCSSLRSININGCNVDHSKPLVCESTGSPFKLEEISFCGSGILHANFHALLSHCAPILKSVLIRNKAFAKTIQNPMDWIKLCSSGLSVLDLYLVPVGIELLFSLKQTSSHTLEVLDVTHCRGLTEEDYKVLCSVYMPKLRSLTINQLTKTYRHTPPPSFAANYPNLKHVCMNLDLKALLSEAEIIQIFQNFPQIERAEIWSCKSLSLETISTLMEICPNLKSLLLSTAKENQGHQENEDVDRVVDRVVDDQSVEDSSSSEEESLSEELPESVEETQNVCPENHCHHSHHGDSTFISNEDFEELIRRYPHVEFKIWHHTISGNRHFRFHQGLQVATDPEPKINHLEVSMKNIDGATVPTVLVDNIPIWSNETEASLCHLKKTTEGGETAGALPLISDWCCECNIESYNGVLFYHDENHVYWETHDPGLKQKFQFSKAQYTSAIHHSKAELCSSY